jgi:hypothetical protein
MYSTKHNYHITTDIIVKINTKYNKIFRLFCLYAPPRGGNKVIYLTLKIAYQFENNKQV